MTAMGALAGIRVLEIGEMVSAPYATKLLADLGADVIKVEPPDGDRARRRGPFRPSTGPHPDGSGLFLALNTGKRSIVAAGPSARVAALTSTADIVVTNRGPEALAELGVDLDRVRAERPELVVCSITPFGLTGPYAGYRAEEITVTNAGGWAYQCPGASPDVDQPPLKVFGHQADFHAGIAAATVTLAAHGRAARTGVGDHIDFSAMAHIAGLLEAALIAASYMDEDPSRLGSRLLNPWGMFPCLDDALIFMVTVEQDQWERLVGLMDSPEWAATGLFDTTELRLENEDLLRLYLEEWTSGQSMIDLWHRGQAERVCFAPVLTMADMEAQDHLADRGFFVDVDHPVAGRVKHLGAPFVSTPDLRRPTAPAPVLDPAAEPAFSETDQVVHADPGRGAEAGRPLEGVRVLDLTWVWAGPYCTLHLAHLGADVIKIESALRPDLGRRLPLHPPDVEPGLNTSAYFNQWSQGKRSCQVDLSHPEAVGLIKELVAESDVVVENFATGVMDKLGLGYEQLRAVKPDIIVASISGYGSTGPLARYMGYGPTTGPLSGLSSLTGYQGGPPRELGLSIGDPGAGITCAFAICAALTARRTTGVGCYIDTALWEATASNAVEGWMAHALGAGQPHRMGNRDPLMAPHGCYRTGDRPAEGDDDRPDPGCWITIACATDEEWAALATQIDPALVGDHRFASAEDRKANEDELDRLIGAWVAGQDRWDLTGKLQQVGVAAFPSMSPKDLLADEHLAARRFIERLDHPEVGRRAHAGIPWRSATGPNGVASAAPLLGQHTEDVLFEVLSYDAERFDALRRSGLLE